MVIHFKWSALYVIPLLLSPYKSPAQMAVRVRQMANKQHSNKIQKSASASASPRETKFTQERNSELDENTM